MDPVRNNRLQHMLPHLCFALLVFPSIDGGCRCQFLIVLPPVFFGKKIARCWFFSLSALVPVRCCCPCPRCCCCRFGWPIIVVFVLPRASVVFNLPCFWMGYEQQRKKNTHTNTHNNNKQKLPEEIPHKYT